MKHEIVVNILDLVSFILVLPEVISDRTMELVKAKADYAIDLNHHLFGKILKVDNVVNIIVPTAQPYFTIWLMVLILGLVGFIAGIIFMCRS